MFTILGYAFDIAINTFLSFYLLWILFGHIMNLKRARDAGPPRVITFLWMKFNAGGLSNTTYCFALPILIFGLAVDIFCNLIILTTILGEIPEKGEWTVTARLQRHARMPAAGRRRNFAFWIGTHFTDQLDPSGKHILP